MKAPPIVWVLAPPGPAGDTASTNLCVKADQKFKVKVITPVGPASSRTFTTSTTVERRDCRNGLRHIVRNNGTQVRNQTLGNISGPTGFLCGP